MTTFRAKAGVPARVVYELFGLIAHADRGAATIRLTRSSHVARNTMLRTPERDVNAG